MLESKEKKKLLNGNNEKDRSEDNSYIKKLEVQ